MPFRTLKTESANARDGPSGEVRHDLQKQRACQGKDPVQIATFFYYKKVRYRIMSIKRKEDCKMQNAHVLHFTSCRNGSASHAAVDAAERFLKSASVLPPGGSLTLLIKALPNNNSTAFVLSDPETNVTAQDLDWIFSGCAETAVSDTPVLDDLFSDGNRIYSVLSDPEHTQDQFTYSNTY